MSYKTSHFKCLIFYNILKNIDIVLKKVYISQIYFELNHNLIDLKNDIEIHKN